MATQIARKDTVDYPGEARLRTLAAGDIPALDSTSTGPATPLDPLVIALARAVNRIGRTAS
jgi:hypothetical protein